MLLAQSGVRDDEAGPTGQLSPPPPGSASKIISINLPTSPTIWYYSPFASSAR
ncbi:MAG: hypothetical protein ACFB21_00080 [Opitutales bacterium]